MCSWNFILSLDEHDLFITLSFPVLQWRESWLLCFNSSFAVVWLSELCVSSLQCYKLVYGLWLWHFLVLLPFHEPIGESSKFPKSWTCSSKNKNLKLAVCLQNIKTSKYNGQLPLDKLKLNQKSYYNLQNFLIILKTFTHVNLARFRKT